jgi:hypothetical protein
MGSTRIAERHGQLCAMVGWPMARGREKRVGETHHCNVRSDQSSTNYCNRKQSSTPFTPNVTSSNFPARATRFSSFPLSKTACQRIDTHKHMKPSLPDSL